MGTIAKSSITLTSISDAYSVALTPSSCVIHADFDGSNPQLTRAYTLISIFCGDIKVPISVNTAAIEKSDAGIGYSIVKVDDYNYKLSITSLATSILEGYIEVPVLTGVDLVLPARFPFTVVRESSMLDWIQEWESNKTTLGDSYVITPKIFVGKKITGSYDNLAAVPGLTGVYIGPSANDSCGVYGYKNSIEIFHLDETGGKIGGWDILEGGIYSTDGRLKILSDGHIKAVNAEGDSIWEINSDGSASFAMENVRFYANGDAEFKGKITSSEGKIGGWTINDIALYNLQIGLNSTKKHIAIANITAIPITTSNTWDGDHITWVKAYGGVAMYYTSNADYGFIGYKGSTKVFSAGSSNYIAGWNFDGSAIWLGTKNNNVNQYTAAVGDVTLGTNGLRGYTWYINTDGTASFVKGYVKFNQTSGLIAGWTFDQYRLSTKYASLVSQDGYSGLYLSIADTSAVGTGSLASNIQTNGGLYLQATSTDVVLASYNSSGSLQFKVTKTSGLIAGWTFDPTAIYTGTKVTSGFTLASGSMTLGADGLRGPKWRFEKDGSGSIAGGNISWDASGNVSFGSNVSLAWVNISGAIGNKLTKIDANGIYTGTLTASQVNALTCTFDKGTIGGWTITSNSISKNNIYLGSNGDLYCSYENTEYWRIDNTGSAKFAAGKVSLNKDGSGSIAGGNISWDASGNAAFKGSLTAISGKIGNWSIIDGVITSNTANNYIKLDADNMCIIAQTLTTGGSYDMNSSFGAILSMQASNGVIQAQAKNAPSYSTAVSYMSSNGIFSNIAGINGMPSSSGYTHRGAVVGLGFANVNKSIWDVNSEQTIVAGVYGRASNSGTAPAFGGFFYNLFAGGMILGRKCVTGTSDSTVYLNQSETLIIGYTSAIATVYLPTSPQEGQIILFKQWWTGRMRVRPRSGQTLYDDSTANEYYDVTQGEMLVAIFTIGYITSGDTTTKVEAWLVNKFKY